MRLLVYIIVIMAMISYIIAAIIYRCSGYYKITKKPYFMVLFDKGAMGEYRTYRDLSYLEHEGARFLYNCYLPREKGKTTEIDLIMIHRSGIYVFESKNFSGWIFGNEDNKTWTQSLRGRRGRAHKEHFYNPIWQNDGHIKWMINRLGNEYNTCFHSLIVFSNRCELKDVSYYSNGVYVINRYEVAGLVNDIDSHMGSCLSNTDIEKIYGILSQYMNVSDKVKQEHVENIKHPNRNNRSTKVDKPMVNTQTDMICPKCGGKLVLRTAKKGQNVGNQFYGCSNYPKCRFIKNKE